MQSNKQNNYCNSARGVACRHSGRLTHRMDGFNLVELMVVVVIIGVLATVAVPSYKKYRVEASRSDAITSLLRIATLQELFYAENSFYAHKLDFGVCGLRYDETATFGSEATAGSLEDNYQITMTVKAAEGDFLAPSEDSGGCILPVSSSVSNFSSSAQRFIITATPKAGSRVEGDTLCQTFSIDNYGFRQATGEGEADGDGNETSSDNTAACWRS